MAIEGACYAFWGWTWPAAFPGLPPLGAAGAFLGLFLAFRLAEAVLLGASRRDRDRALRRWRDEGWPAVQQQHEVARLLEEAVRGLCPGVQDPAGSHPRPADRIEALAAHIRALAGEVEALRGTDGQLTGLLASSPRLTDLFQAHLKETEAETERATLAILEKLMALNFEVGKLLSTLDDTMFNAANLYNSAQDKVKESRQMMEEINVYKHHLDAEIQAAIVTLGHQVEELRPFTDLIRDVTERTNVLAINASIEAARAGKAGTGFAVVAGEVRQLSQQVAKAADSIELSVQQVSETVNQRLSAIAVQLRDENEAQGLSALSAALPRLSQDFHQTVEVLNRFAHETHETVEGMRSSILEVLGVAQFQDITRQQIEQVRAGLGLLGAHLGSVAQTVEAGAPVTQAVAALDQITDDLNRSYTMLLQKKTHQEVLAGAAEVEEEEDRPPIELF